MFRINVVEDEERLQRLLAAYLEKEGYIVTAFSSAEEAQASVGNADLWLLDISLPGMDGMEFFKYIKADDPDIPVIFASARDSEIDRILGLHLGSDDYVTKPFSMDELILRIKNVLRRTYRNHREEEIIYGPYIINTRERFVYFDAGEIKLTSKEFDVLILFAANKNKPFTRDMILNYIWGNDYFGSDRVVDDTIRRIRKKMEQLNFETIYGYGYRLL